MSMSSSCSILAAGRVCCRSRSSRPKDRPFFCVYGQMIFYGVFERFPLCRERIFRDRRGQWLTGRHLGMIDGKVAGKQFHFFRRGRNLECVGYFHGVVIVGVGLQFSDGVSRCIRHSVRAYVGRITVGFTIYFEAVCGRCCGRCFPSGREFCRPDIGRRKSVSRCDGLSSAFDPEPYDAVGVFRYFGQRCVEFRAVPCEHRRCRVIGERCYAVCAGKASAARVPASGWPSASSMSTYWWAALLFTRFAVHTVAS